MNILNEVLNLMENNGSSVFVYLDAVFNDTKCVLKFCAVCHSKQM